MVLIFSLPLYRNLNITPPYPVELYSSSPPHTGNTLTQVSHDFSFVYSVLRCPSPETKGSLRLLVLLSPQLMKTESIIARPPLA